MSKTTVTAKRGTAWVGTPVAGQKISAQLQGIVSGRPTQNADRLMTRRLGWRARGCVFALPVVFSSLIA